MKLKSIKVLLPVFWNSSFNSSSIAGKNDAETRISLRPILHFLMTISLVFSFCLAVNELRIVFYETIHRKSVLNTIEFRFFSAETDSVINLILMVFFACLFFFKPIRGKALKLKMLMPLIFTLVSCLLFLAGFRTFSLALLLSSHLTYLVLNRELKQFFEVFIQFLIVVEALSLLRWLTYPVFPTEIYSDPSWFLPRLESFMFFFFESTLGNLIILSFIFSFTVFILPYISRIRIKDKGIRVELSRLEKLVDNSRVSPPSLKLPDGRILLIFAFLILLYLSYIPYFQSLNPRGRFVSVDLVFYTDYLDTLKSLGLGSEGLNYLLGSKGERATAIFLTYLVSIFLSLSSAEAVKASLFIASYLLVLATYFSLKSASGNNSLAGFSVFFSIFSIQTVVGLYAGYLANMVAIPLLLLMTLCFFHAIEGETECLIFAILFSTVALYSHPWSWMIFVLAILLLLPLNLMLSTLGVRRRYSGKEVRIIILFTLINLALDVSKQLLFKSAGGISAEYAVSRSSLSISNIFLLNRNMDFMRQVFVGGYTSNVLVYMLAAIGIVYLLAFNNPFFDSLFLLLPVTAVPFILSNPTAQSRLLYLLPTNIYATVGLYRVLKHLERRRMSQRAFATLVLLSLANYGFRSVANLV